MTDDVLLARLQERLGNVSIAEEALLSSTSATNSTSTTTAAMTHQSSSPPNTTSSSSKSHPFSATAALTELLTFLDLRIALTDDETERDGYERFVVACLLLLFARRCFVFVVVVISWCDRA